MVRLAADFQCRGTLSLKCYGSSKGGNGFWSRFFNLILNHHQGSVFRM